MNSSSALKSHRRKSSRTNSTSSSVVTVKLVAGLSSRSGSRTPHSRPRPRSPDQLGPQLAALLSSAESISEGRRSSSCSRPSSSSGIQHGVGNLNRWSHSTTSSTSGQESGQGRRRKGSASGPSSTGYASRPSLVPLERFASSAVGATQSATSYARRAEDVQSLSHGSLGRSPQGQIEAHETTSEIHPPPLLSSSLLSSSGFQSDTSSSVSATPLTSDMPSSSATTSAPSDYFGEKWRVRSDGSRTSRKRDSVQVSSSQNLRDRTLEAALATRRLPPANSPSPSPDTKSRNHRAGRHGKASRAHTGVDVGSSISSTNSDRERPRRQRSPTQKTMLSKALAKANTAVLLDNALNYEGAMGAYQDACKLLHEVMMRSSGEDDKRKLEAIVGDHPWALTSDMHWLPRSVSVTRIESPSF